MSGEQNFECDCCGKPLSECSNRLDADVVPHRKRVKEWEKRKCVCGGIVKGILLDGIIYSCNIRRCDKCKKKYYSKGYSKLKFVESFRLTDFKEYADLV